MEVASAIGGLISLGLEVLTILHTYIGAARSAPRVAHQLYEELESLNQTLNLFRKKASSQIGQARFPETSVLFASTNSCHGRLQRLRKDLQPLAEGTGLRRIFHRFKWPLDESDVEDDIAALHRLSQVYLFSLSIEGLYVTLCLKKMTVNSLPTSSLLSDRLEAAVSGMAARLQELDQDHSAQGKAVREELNATVEALRGLFKLPAIMIDISNTVDKQKLQQEVRDLRDAIPAFDSSSRQRDLQWRRSKGTGKWLFETDEFKHWMEGKALQGTLFCHGCPGSGKTYLTSTVINYLQQQAAQSEAVRVAYFFFDYLHRQQQGPDCVVGSLLKQLLSAYDSVPPSAAGLQQRFKKGPPDWSDLLTELINMCSESSETFIVLDALDECEGDVGLSRILELVSRLRTSGIRLFVTSRPYSNTINQAFKYCSQILIRASDEDISMFLHERIASRLDESIDETLQRDIVKAILGKSQGMFLISALQVAYVLDQPSVEGMRQSLGDLPDDPDENFNRTLLRINKQLSARRKLGITTLMWLTHASKPLSKDELREAVAIVVDSLPPTVGPRPNPDKIVESCIGLVNINEDGSFRLVHLSVQEYLRQNTDRLFAAGDAQLARLCLAYIRAAFNAEPSIQADENLLQAAFDGLPLLRYTADFWGVHASLRFTAEVEADVCDFLATPALVLVWSRLSQAIKPFNDVSGREYLLRYFREGVWIDATGVPTTSFSTLHIAARFGLLNILQEELSAHAVDVNCQYKYGARYTPLMMACRHGSSGAVSIFLARPDLHLNQLNDNRETALCIAVKAHEIGIAKRLLDDPRLDINLGRPLLGAVDARDRNMVELLLGFPALDVNDHEDGAESALWKAVSEALYDIVVLILRRDDLNPSIGCPKSDKNAVLHFAELFIEDMDIMTDSEIRDCAMMMLALGKHSIVEPWISKDVTISFAWIMYECGPASSRKLFKETGLVRFVNQENRTLLHEAAERGNNEECIRQLLKDGADPEAKTTDGLTPLHEAMKAKSIVPAEILLSAGVDINAQDDDGWTPLHHAVWQDRKEHIELLLSRGADVHLLTKKKYSVLVAACIFCTDPAIPCLLLDNGADPEQPDELGRRPLHIAIFRGQKEICQLLLQPQYHVDINAEAPSLGTSLSIATWLMNDCIEPLLAAGLDVNAIDVYGRTPLDWAARYEPVFKLFEQLCRDYKPTPREKTVAVLGESIRRLLHSVSAQSNSPPFLLLSRLLYMLGDKGSALTLSRTLVKSTENGVVSEVNLSCSACKSLSGVHFVCGTCPMTNFCASCISSPVSKEKAPWCHGHGFWKVPDEGWTDVHVLAEEEKDTIIAEIAEKYI